ncbi:MAG: twin-arginine translocation signal domain-containing protein [Betaproteobacteria bacterium]|nr:MAG: twin-arginine translocation signal domain-containing protein [Betaproteobacteria bacterium]
MNARIDLSLSRREFLKASGALVVSAAGPAFTGETLAQTAAVSPGSKPPLLPSELDSWVAILPDGRVSAFFGKMDMGQSLDIAIAQIVADELDVDVAKVDVVMGDTALTCNQGGASGSTGIQTGARPLRSAAAEARRLLVQSASQKLGLPVEQLRVDDGVVSAVSDPRKKASYAELIGGRHFHHQVEWNKQIGNPMDIKVQATPKSPADYRVVGKSLRRRDVAGKVYRTDKYVTDISLPKMLHARVIRCSRAACTVGGVDEGSIRAVKGARVVREKDFVAVVADHEWDAVRASRMLKISWKEAKKNPFPPMAEIYDHIRKAPVVKREDAVKKGDVDGVFKTAVAREHGARLRGCRCARRRRHGLDRLAEAALRPDRGGAAPRRGARESARHLGNRSRFLRAQRRRRRGARRGAPLQAHGAPGARAGHAQRRDRLGSEGPGVGAPRPRRARCFGQGDRLRVRLEGLLAQEH